MQLINLFFLKTAFFSGLTDQTQSAATAGWSVVGVMLLPIVAVLVAYLVFKCRVRVREFEPHLYSFKDGFSTYMRATIKFEVRVVPSFSL